MIHLRVILPLPLPLQEIIRMWETIPFQFHEKIPLLEMILFLHFLLLRVLFPLPDIKSVYVTIKPTIF
jgi:hypothetical protein